MSQEHGGNLRLIAENNSLNVDNLIDFSANINPMGMPEEFKTVIFNNLESVESYPDYKYSKLKDTLQEFYNVDKSNITVTNGAEEGIRNLMHILPDTVILIEPTFSEYRKAAESFEKLVLSYRSTEEEGFSVDFEKFLKWLEKIKKKQTSMTSYWASIFLCNPNNPTGVNYNEKTLSALTKKLKKLGVILIIDESFIDFLDDKKFSMTEHITNHNNLILIKSMTKFYSIPGLRLGVVLFGSVYLNNLFKNYIPMWSVNVFADLCGQTLMNLEYYRQKSLVYIMNERERIMTFLKTFSRIELFESSCNFIFFKYDGEDLFEPMLKENIVIRSCSNFNGLSSKYYRIAIRTHEENNQLIDAFENVFRKLK